MPAGGAVAAAAPAAGGAAAAAAPAAKKEEPKKEVSECRPREWGSVDKRAAQRLGYNSAAGSLLLPSCGARSGLRAARRLAGGRHLQQLSLRRTLAPEQRSEAGRLGLCQQCRTASQP